MREFKKRYSKRQEILRFFVGAAAALVLLYITVKAIDGAWGMYEKFSEAAQGDQAAAVQLQQLQQQKAQVSGEVAQLQTSRGVEAAVRENYGLARPGEGEIQIVQSSTSSNATTTPQASVWARIWHTIFPW